MLLHPLILDLGPAGEVDFAVESLGKSFEPVEGRAIVILCETSMRLMTHFNAQ